MWLCQSKGPAVVDRRPEGILPGASRRDYGPETVGSDGDGFGGAEGGEGFGVGVDGLDLVAVGLALFRGGVDVPLHLLSHLETRLWG